MSRPLLMQRWRSSSTSELGVFRWINGSLTQIGGDFGVNHAATTNEERRAYNRVIQWQNDLWCPGNENFWKYDVANSGSWSVLGLSYATGVAPRTLSANWGRQGAVMPMEIGGEPYLVTPVVVDGGDHCFIRIDVSGVMHFPDSAVGDSTFHDDVTDEFYDAPVVFNNNYWWISTNNSAQFAVFSYDPNSNTISKAWNTAQLASSPRGDLCPFDNQMYAWAAGGNTPYYLWRVQGTDLFRVEPAISTNEKYTNGRGCLFSWNDKLYGFALADGAVQDGWQAFEMEVTTTGVIPIEITDPVIPSLLRRDNGVASRSIDENFYSYMDLETDPGNPTVYLFYSAQDSEGTSISMYRWEGPGGEITYLGAGGDQYQFSIPVSKMGGGHRIWSGSGELIAGVLGSTVNMTTIDLEYSITGGSGEPVNVQWYWTNVGEQMTNLASLENPSEGTLVLGNTTISGVAADGLPKTVRWRALSDGIRAADQIKIVPRVFIST